MEVPKELEDRYPEVDRLITVAIPQRASQKIGGRWEAANIAYDPGTEILALVCIRRQTRFGVEKIPEHRAAIAVLLKMAGQDANKTFDDIEEAAS